MVELGTSGSCAEGVEICFGIAPVNPSQIWGPLRHCPRAASESRVRALMALSRTFAADLHTNDYLDHRH